MGSKHKLPPRAARYQLRLALADLEPAVWRRVVVPSDITLDRLHEVFQSAMGWWEERVWRFETKRRRFGDFITDAERRALDAEDAADDDLLSASHTRLSEIVSKPGSTFRYRFDVETAWEHEATLEDVLPADDADRRAVCTDGAGASPPEDTTSAEDYRTLLAALTDRAHAEYLDAREILGPRFDPAAFDVGEVNTALEGVLDPARRMRRVTRTSAAHADAADVDGSHEFDELSELDEPWAPLDYDPRRREIAKLAALALQGPPDAPWRTSMLRLAAAAEADEAELLAVVRAMRDAGVLPAGAVLYLSEMLAEPRVFEAIATEPRMVELRSQMDAIEAEHGLGEDEYWEDEEAPPDYQTAAAEWERLLDELFDRVMRELGVPEAADARRADLEAYLADASEGRAYFHGEMPGEERAEE